VRPGEVWAILKCIPGKTWIAPWGWFRYIWSWIYICSFLQTLKCFQFTPSIHIVRGLWLSMGIEVVAWRTRMELRKFHLKLDRFMWKVLIRLQPVWERELN
jgi:hypothetical protein